MQHIEISTPKKEPKIDIQEFLNSNVKLRSVYLYQEPNAKSWDRNIYRFCVISNDGKNVRFLHNNRIFDAKTVRSSINLDNHIECLYKLGVNTNGFKENKNIMEFTVSHCLADLCNCDAINAPFPNSIKSIFKDLKHKKEATVANLLQHEQIFTNLQHDYINKNKKQTEVFEF